MDRQKSEHYPRPQLDLELLRTFVAAADSGSLTNAGHRIGRSQSTISSQISRLEGLTKSRLLIRSKQGVSVTPAGAVLLEYARELLRIEGDALAALRLPAGSGKVRLGTQESLAARQLPGLLVEFIGLHSAFEIEVVTGLAVDLTNLLRSEQLDLVLIRQKSDGREEARELWREPLVWAGTMVPHQAGNGPLPLAVHPPGCFYRETMLDGLAEQAIDYRLVFTSSCTASLQAAVTAGLGISAFAEGTIPPSLPLVAADSGLPRLGEAVIRLYRSTKRKNTAAEAFAEFMEERLAQSEPAQQSP